MKTDSQEKSDFSGFLKDFLEREYGAHKWRPRNANRNSTSAASNEPNPETSESVCRALPLRHKEF